jgi:serine/threonine-protein phosphatase 2A regulatory subunit A
LTESVDDEDEVLLALANSLGKMIRLVGGTSHAHSLLPPLELLLMVEEITVRDAASASTQTISDSLPDETFQNQYAAMLKRLATKEWFTARISSAGLMAKAYPRLTSTQQTEHIQLFARLCKDDTPMVRRVAAQYLGKMLENVVHAVGRTCLEEEGVATKLLIPLYEELASNDQPVRVSIFYNMATCCQRCGLADDFLLFDPGLCSLTNYRELCVIWSSNWRVGHI